MQSMTGFGRGEASLSGLRVTVECASVNRKQADVAINLPREWAALETEVREEVLRHISRGRIAVAVTLEKSGTQAAAVIDLEAAKRAHDELTKLQRTVGLSAEIGLPQLLSFPGVLSSGQLPPPEAAWKTLEKALKAALGAMVGMRSKEGGVIVRELRGRIGALQQLIVKIRKLAKKVPGAHRERLLARLKTSGLELDAADPRVVAEIAIFAERCDISEELERLDSHFLQFLERLKSAEPSGRALEFLVQEIFRELNTSGTKAADAAISQLVVDCKAELERIREQLANLE